MPSTQTYHLAAELVEFSKLLLSSDKYKLELFHAGGKEMILVALNLWVDYFCSPLKSSVSIIPPEVLVIIDCCK